MEEEEEMLRIAGRRINSLSPRSNPAVSAVLTRNPIHGDHVSRDDSTLPAPSVASLSAFLGTFRGLQFFFLHIIPQKHI